MESNGTRNRIHVSQATADELVNQGKKSWLTARAEKVVAKGKGEMQTYWVEVKGGNSQSTSVTGGYNRSLSDHDPLFLQQLEKESGEAPIENTTLGGMLEV